MKYKSMTTHLMNTKTRTTPHTRPIIGASVAPFVMLLLWFGSAVAPNSANADTGDKASSAPGNGDGMDAASTPHRDWLRSSLSSAYILGGMANIDLDALNGRLVRAGYDKIDAPAVPLGFGFTHRMNRFVIGLDWHFMLHNMPKSPDENIRVDLRNWYWQLQYGLDIVRVKNLGVYALVGAGVGHTAIWISDEQGESFNGVLNAPMRSSYMTQTSLVLSATLGVDYLIETSRTARKTSYITVGLRGGYIFSPFAGDWRTHAAEIQNGPTRGMNGPVALITLGFAKKRHPPK